MRGFVWKSDRDTSKGQVHCSEDPKWWGELRGYKNSLGALLGFVRTVYHPCIYVYSTSHKENNTVRCLKCSIS